MKIFKKTTLLLALVCATIFSSAPNCFANSTITIKGSTTVLPIAQNMAEVFMDRHHNVNISVQGGGSGVGIASIIEGTCDIADSSRKAKDKEIKKAKSNGINLTANIIAMDGIAVIVHPSNKIYEITKKQIKDIYTGKISNWSKVGGKKQRIVAISRDTASGTFEAFNKLVLKKERVRQDALMQASNQTIVSIVSKTSGAIGYVGLGYLSNKVKALIVNGVKPSKQTVASGTYSLSRPLFMYTNGKPKGTVKKFVDFILSEEGQKIVEEIGYIGLKRKNRYFK